MNTKKVVNIVSFQVTDVVGSTKTNWNQAIVFYDDGTARIETVDGAKAIADIAGIKVVNTDTSDLTKNYTYYKTITGYHPGMMVPKTKAELVTEKDAKAFDPSTFIPKPEEVSGDSSSDEDTTSSTGEEDTATSSTSDDDSTSDDSDDEEDSSSKDTDDEDDKEDSTVIPPKPIIPGKEEDEYDEDEYDEDDEYDEPKKRKGLLGLLATPFVGLAGWATKKFLNKPKEKKLSYKIKNFFTGKADKVKEKASSTVKDAFYSDSTEKTVAMPKTSTSKKKKSKTSKASTGKTTKTSKVFKTSKKKKKGSKKGLFARIGAAATACLVALGLMSCSAPNVSNPNAEATTASQTATDEDVNGLTDEELVQRIQNGEYSLEEVKEMLLSGKITNDILDGLSFDQLVEVSHSEIQQQEMSKIGNYLDYFNGTFADHYLESSHPDVRAALSWEEVSAINLAYNEFSKEDVKAIFNGYEVNSADFTSAYKEATLQLMGAFVLESRDMPVNLDQLLNTQEGKDFYNKYNDLFLRCKETTGQDQINAVNAFYQELYKDFPISSEVREVGISHAESRDDIEAYKLSVTPMVAAAEMMFQNLEIDHTLSDQAIAYFNDLGLCEFAQGSFDRAEKITLCVDEDETLPTYEQFANAKIEELKKADHYFSSDKERDLSQYDLFQKWVNGHFNLDAAGEFVMGGSISQTVSSKVVDTYTTSSTTYSTEHSEGYGTREEAVAAVGEEEVKRQEEAINNQFDQWNQAQKEQGEAEAEQNRQELQDQADKEAEEIRDEIEKDDQDMQEDIDHANDQIDQNNSDNNPDNDTSVNEDDFGDHDVDFDDQHSDNQGNLDDSVEDITQDGTGANQDLPDPNQSGQDLDNNEPEYNGSTSSGTTTGGSSSTTTPSTTEPTVTQTPSGVTIVESEEPVAETPQETYSAPAQTTTQSSTTASSPVSTNEEIADAIVEDMANNPTQTEEEVFVYTK